jgi:hypothetical protein
MKTIGIMILGWTTINILIIAVGFLITCYRNYVENKIYNTYRRGDDK